MTQPSEPEYRLIPLTHGLFTRVSAHRFEWLNQWQWHATKTKAGNSYAVRTEWQDGKQKTIIMAREIMNAATGTRVDHISRNTLDNSDENLRLATAGQNAANRKQRKDSRWPYKGVYQMRGRWCAAIRSDNVRRFLGGYDTAEQARDAYIAAAHKLHQEYACFDASEEPLSCHEEDAKKCERATQRRKGRRAIRLGITQPDDPSIRHIALTHAQVVIVDAWRYLEFSGFNWHAAWNAETRSYYVTRSQYDPQTKKQRTVWLHKEVIGAPSGVKVDHKNRITLDCREENLRVATDVENACNHTIRRDNKTGLKGVSFSPCIKSKPWKAQIASHGKVMHLGYFADPTEAAAAYQKAALELQGAFAHF